MVFSYSLPSKASSSPRVALWRRLQRSGAITPKAGVYVLPERDECVEAFQWLAQEVQQAKGEAVVMRVERFEGLTDPQIIELFRDSCRKKYSEIESEAAEVEKSIHATKKSKSNSGILERLEKLRKKYAEVAQVDFFESAEGAGVASQIRNIQQALRQGTVSDPAVASVTFSEYRDKRWVTRPRPHVDRLGCAWLIRRFIDPKADIRYATNPGPDEVTFDMRGAEFGHTGDLCTFETMITAFGLREPALRLVAEIIHDIDIRDGRYARPEIGGIDIILKGWLLAGLPDRELESRGIELFESLYTAFSRRPRLAER
ncbi:MAG: hypothetical protein EPO02_05685 [Nitrospirae bacterium]|nr:MAG: hypothetical protein EPO02_05685 [Nitrospirota bacterium]